jgi:hypothetical protein
MANELVSDEFWEIIGSLLPEERPNPKELLVVWAEERIYRCSSQLDKVELSTRLGE